jgi:hypothetical protein
LFEIFPGLPPDQTMARRARSNSVHSRGVEG